MSFWFDLLHHIGIYVPTLQPSKLSGTDLLPVVQIHYARANALASYKAKNIEDVAGVC